MARGEEQAALLLDEIHGHGGNAFDIDEHALEKEYVSSPTTGPRNTSQQITNVLRLSGTLFRAAFLYFLHSLIPSFFRRSDPAAKTKLHPTAYLDGLRGVAAFIVYIHHFILDWFPSLSNGYGSSPADTRFIQIPIIRIVYAGMGMVTTFFIISGYVLSYKALRQIRAGQYPALLDSLASSVFRRGMRLFLPTTFSTFVSLCFARRNWYLHDPLGHNLIPPRMGDSFFGQMKDWWKHTIKMSNPFQNVDVRNIFVHPYAGHLWTIPIEFRGSFVVFLTLLGFAKLPNTTRLILLAGLVAYTLWMLHWDLFLFLSGTLFADLGFAFAAHAARAADSLNHPPDVLDRITNFINSIPRLARLTPARRSLFVTIASKVVMVIGLWFLCFPVQAAGKSPGYITLSQFAPKVYIDTKTVDKFWYAIGAFLLCGSICASPTLQRPFTTGFAQYLARISFALYLVHGAVLYTLGMKILHRALAPPPGWTPQGEEKWQPLPWNYGWSFISAVIVNTSLCIWAADWVWRMVDAKAVTFARWVSEQLWIKEVK